MLGSGFSLAESNPLHLIQFMLHSTEREEVEEGKEVSLSFFFPFCKTKGEGMVK